MEIQPIADALLSLGLPGLAVLYFLYKNQQHEKSIDALYDNVEKLWEQRLTDWKYFSERRISEGDTKPFSNASRAADQMT